MGDAPTVFERRLGGPDVHASVDLDAVDRHDLGPGHFGDPQCDLALAGRGGAEYRPDGQLATRPIR
jgi:hypothetical protein